MVVDLPAPFGPSSPTHVPWGTSRSSPSTAVIAPKRLTTRRRRMAGGAAATTLPGWQAASGGSGHEREARPRGRVDEPGEQREVLAAVDHRLRVPLDAHQERPRRVLDRLDRAVRRVRDGAQAGAQHAGRLVMEGVDGEAPRADEAGEARADRQADLVCGLGGRRRLAMVVDVL